MRRIMSEFDANEYVHLCDLERFERELDAAGREDDPPQLKTLCGELLVSGCWKPYDYRSPNSADLDKADCRFCLRTYLGVTS